MTTVAPARPAPLLRGELRPFVLGSVALVSLFAFEAIGVATAMPAVAAALDGVAGYALAFGVPLATAVLGMALAGAWGDARGPAPALRAGVAAFVAGLLAAGLAPTMAVLVAGRALQGLGSGLLSVALYVLVGRCVPVRWQPRVFAWFAAAWVLPSVAGPPVAGLLVEHVGWRWVFLAAAVLALPAAALLEPALRGARGGAGAPGSAGQARRRVGWAAAAAAGAMALHQAGQAGGAAAALLGAAGLVAVGVAAPRLLPPGALRARPGLPAVVTLRGLVAAAFFAAETFLPLLLVRERGLPPALAGLALTAAALSWTAGSWYQGRERAPAPRVLVRAGTAALAAGVLVTAAVVAPGVPAAVGVAGWFLAGLGMGLTYPTLSVLTLRLSEPGAQGAATSALQLADHLFSGVVLAVSGALFAALLAAGPPAYLAGFGVAAALALVAVAVGRRVG